MEKHHVAIWIDDKEAILLVFDADPREGLDSNSPGNGWSQHHVSTQQHLVRQQYYDAVLSYLGPGDEVLILGPGSAKRELCQRIKQHAGLKGNVVGLRRASGLAKVELVFPTIEAMNTSRIALPSGDQ